MTTADDRDAQIASLIRCEIIKVRNDARRCGWAPQSSAWNRAFGEIAGMYKILALVDPNPHEGQRIAGLLEMTAVDGQGTVAK